MLLVVSSALATGLSAQDKSPPHALLSSLTIPGGGQFYCENDLKGVAFFVAQTFFLAASVLEHQAAEDYYVSYLDHGDPADYDRYVSHANRRTDYLWFGAACYALSAADAYVGAHFFRFEAEGNMKLALFQIRF